MKHKSILGSASLLLALACTLWAADKPAAPTSTPRVAYLKCNGNTLAELHLPKGTELSVSAKQTGYDTKTQHQVAKGDVKIEIHFAGRTPVVIKAEEMEMVPSGL